MAPEQNIPGMGTYGNYRRHELHAAAIDRGLVSAKSPRPTKAQLIIVLENNIKMAEDQAPPPVSKPVLLNEAHLPESQRTTGLDAETAAATVRLLDAIEASEVEPDPFADVKTPVEIFTEFSQISNIMKLKSHYHKTFVELPKLENNVGKDALMAQVRINLELD